MIVPSWVAPASVRAFTTTRLGGFSQAPYQGFNLALHVGDDPLHVLQNRKLLAVKAALPAEPLWLQQVHGTCVFRHAEPLAFDTSLGSTAAEADASIAFESAQKIDPTHLMAWLGPAISVKHYEVGADVFEAFKLDERAQGFIKTGTDKWHCDLYVLARKRLKDLGLCAKAISGGDYCTYADPRFYSYRRSGVTGRMATMIWLAPP